VALLPRYTAAIVGFGLLGLAIVVFNPSWQAYLGDNVPYGRRGRVVALTELAWAASLLIGAPVVGQVIERRGWRAPFGLLALLAFAGAFGILLVLPSEGRRTRERLTAASLASPFRLVLSTRPAVVMLLVSFLLMASNEVLFVVYGAWMETSFGLSVGALGVATVVIGSAEILAELGAGGIADRLGKRWSVTAGLVLTAAAYVALPFMSTNLQTSLVGLFLVFLCFEFAVVSNLPLTTELVPGARGTMMALNVAALSLGRAVAAPLGTALWSAGGLVWNGLASATATLLAVGLLLAFVHEGELGRDEAAA
jgi:predicted MFS family arabinose efflux permease